MDNFLICCEAPDAAASLVKHLAFQLIGSSAHRHNDDIAWFYAWRFFYLLFLK